MGFRWIPIIATLAVMLIGHILSRVALADYEKRAKKTAGFRDCIRTAFAKSMSYKQNWDMTESSLSSLTN